MAGHFTQPGGAIILEAERDRLQNAVLHLESSNNELRASLECESDSVLREALGVSSWFGAIT